MAARFRELSAEELRERSALARARLTATDEFHAARSFLLYMSMPDEPDTAALLDGLLAAGRTVFLPLLLPGGNDIAAVPVSSRERNLAPGRFGILEPLPGLVPAEAEDVDFALVPGRAFDRSGLRLGRGLGCYDRLLAQLGPRAVRAALALDFQIVAAVPAERHDQRVSLIATDRELIRTGG